MHIIISRVITKRIVKYNCQANGEGTWNENKHSIWNKTRKEREKEHRIGSTSRRQIKRRFNPKYMVIIVSLNGLSAPFKLSELI